jgi:hypothetical protein
LSERALLVRIDGALLSEKDARDLWSRFSAYMEEHRGDLGGFAKQEGFLSIRPSFEDGAAILIASHSEAQAPYRSVSAEPGKGGGEPTPRSSRGSEKSQSGEKSRRKKR